MSELNMDPENLRMFSAAWYDAYFSKAEESKVHAEFCERVYGKNLCQHGLMDMEELDFLISLVPADAKILEIGCSNGYISEYIQRATGADYVAVDYSRSAIDQALKRNWESDASIQFACVDLANDDGPGEGYDLIIMIDSIYFIGEYDETLKRLKSKCKPGGKLLVTYFETLEADDDRDEVPQAQETVLASSLHKLNLNFLAYDFSANAREHGRRNFTVGEDLKEDFYAEGKEFLYEARAAENRFFRDHAENETIVRYLYVIDAI